MRANIRRRRAPHVPEASDSRRKDRRRTHADGGARRQHRVLRAGGVGGRAAWPAQARNATLDRQRTVLEVAGLYEPDTNVEQAFGQQVEVRVVDLATGDLCGRRSPAPTIRSRVATRSRSASGRFPRSWTARKIGRRPRYMTVYLVREAATLQRVVLPIYGHGLWGMIYGYLALEGDAEYRRRRQVLSAQRDPGTRRAHRRSAMAGAVARQAGSTTSTAPRRCASSKARCRAAGAARAALAAAHRDRRHQRRDADRPRRDRHPAILARTERFPALNLQRVWKGRG